jgi:hypothetical protein
LLRAARIQIGALKEAVQKAQDAEQWLSDEHAAAEEHARIAEAQSRDYAFRIQQLTDRIRERGEDPDANVALPENWSTFVEWCDERLAGLVTLSQRARKELRQPQFDDPQMAARSLKWLANEYRARRLHGGDGALHGSAIEAGLKNERCGTDAFEIDWAGSRHEVDWHIKNGGNTRYPSRCLRIYYFWDDASQQVVIASMPAHVRSGAT